MCILINDYHSVSKIKAKKHAPEVSRLLMVLVAGVAALGIGAAEPSQARLLLTVMVDGLDTEYLDMLGERLGDGGFRRLQRDGVLIANADYGPGLDATAATATLVSGASPSLSGIGAAQRYDLTAMRPVSTFSDKNVLGNFTDTGYSPAALRVSTIADEARIAAGGTNVAYAVAPSPSQAIALAGHAANAALWLDHRTGNWASSTYYKEMPVAVATRNRTTPLSMRLDTMSWTPSLAPELYPDALPDHLRRYPFRYVFPASNSQRLDIFTASPLVNREVTNVAADLLSTLRVGQHEGVTDVLSLAYTLRPFTYGKNPDNRPELLDAYVKLDRNLEQLFSDIDRRVGLDHTVVLLAATPPRRQSRRDDEQWGIPFGEFSTRKAISLLNIYLMAVYGNGDYVSAYHNGQFYLNRKLIKERSLDERKLRAEAATFLARMTGVDRVHTIDDIIEGRAGEQPEALRRNISSATAGDLLVTVAPGFEIVDDFNTVPRADRIPMVERVATSAAPVFIMAPGVAARTIGETVDARAIAPTVCRILRIRSPNGASAPALPLSAKK